MKLTQIIKALRFLNTARKASQVFQEEYVPKKKKTNYMFAIFLMVNAIVFTISVNFESTILFRSWFIANITILFIYLNNIVTKLDGVLKRL